MGLEIRYTVVEQGNETIVKEIHKAVVHRFLMSDVEDPDLWAGQSLYDWQESDAGKFVMEHSLEHPSWHRQYRAEYMGYEYIIVAELEKAKYSEFLLRFGKHGNNKG